jgi:hypothetical protein
MAATSSGSTSAEFPSFDHVRVAAPGAIFAAGRFVITCGLVLIGMQIGHASGHAYRELVGLDRA